MSDDDQQQPSFFGGLPPRGAPSVVAPERMPRHIADSAEDAQPAPTQQAGPQPGERNTLALVAFVGSFLVSLVGILCGHLALKQIKTTGEGGRRLALAGLIIGYVGFVLGTIALVVFLVVTSVANTAAAAADAELKKTIATENVTKQAEREAIIAEGGGAVPGHVVSADLCTAIDVFTSVGGDAVASQTISPELLAATESLAAVPSPNQAKYQGYLALVKDPASVTNATDAQALSSAFVKAVQADVLTCM